MRTHRATITPRMLTKEQAAGYCGFSSASFAGLCPVPPIAFGSHKRLLRWDIRAIDAWLDMKAGVAAPMDQPTVADMRGRR